MKSVKQQVERHLEDDAFDNFDETVSDYAETQSDKIVFNVVDRIVFPISMRIKDELSC